MHRRGDDLLRGLEIADPRAVGAYDVEQLGSGGTGVGGRDAQPGAVDVLLSVIAAPGPHGLNTESVIATIATVDDTTGGNSSVAAATGESPDASATRPASPSEIMLGQSTSSTSVTSTTLITSFATTHQYRKPVLAAERAARDCVPEGRGAAG